MNYDIPDLPYYAVIFTSVRTTEDNGYVEMSEKMTELASQQEGFLGIESARDELGITVSYWRDLDSIQKWKVNAEHTFARNEGRKTWYKLFKVRIARVEKEYSFLKNSTNFNT
jgi:heme-degrading monooxygenase HmoA